MHMNVVPSEDQVAYLTLDVAAAAAARVADAVESGRSCRHLGRGMMARMGEAVTLYGTGALSLAQAECAIVEAENLALALAPLVG